MQMPKTPPARAELLGAMIDPNGGVDLLSRILDAVTEPTVAGKYLHWDKVRHRDPPEGLNHQQWWFGLQLRRRALAKSVPLEDALGGKFTYSLVDELQESMHDIDSRTRGSIAMPEQVTNSETRSTYVVRSLIEESITTSQLEGASTTREVAKEMIRRNRHPRDRSERMILNSYRTMRKIAELRGERLTRDLVFEIHRIITEGTLNDSTGAGRFRKLSEEIVIGDEYGEVFHRPPSALVLDERMQAMCDFANDVESKPFMHPAVRSMILHFWLTYDHPFIDGNGRTARALFYWSMLRSNYWLFEFISISEIILKSPIQYGRSFLYTETDSNDLTYFLIYHAKVIRESIRKLYEYIDEKSKTLSKIQDELKGMMDLNHRQRALITHALRHPGFIYTYESHRTSHGVVHQTARTDLLDLLKRGYLEGKKIGKSWRFKPVPDLESRLSQP